MMFWRLISSRIVSNIVVYHLSTFHRRLSCELFCNYTYRWLPTSANSPLPCSMDKWVNKLTFMLNSEGTPDSKDASNCKGHFRFLCHITVPWATPRCRGNAVQYGMILHTSLQSPMQNKIRVWSHKSHPIPRPNGWAMGCILQGFSRKLSAS